MNIFNSLKVYAGKWSETGRRPFTPEEKSSVVSAVVKESKFGSSVEFTLNNGSVTYIPLDMNSPLGLGEFVDMNTAEVVTLSKPGETDINRVFAR